MLIPSCRRTVRSLPALALALAVALPAAPVAAQPALEVGIRIGVILPEVPADAEYDWQKAVAFGAEHGAILGQEEHVFNAQILGVDFDVLFETASGPAAAVAAAERLLIERGVFGIIGGYELTEAIALGTWAQARGVPFLNVGVQSDLLRNDMCFATTFHLEPSAAMYLDAIAGWYVRAGFRRWYIITADDDEGDALGERLRWALEERHFGVTEVGQTILTSETDTGADLVSSIERSRADLVVLLIDGADQLRLLADLEVAGLDLNMEVAAFPYPETQTRAFFFASREAAPNLGTNHRATSWEATIDAYGGREYNARYRLRWDGEPMDSVAWAAFHGVKTLFEAAFFGGSVAGEDVLAYLTAATSVFDLHKGIAVTFRSWDHQMRQSLFLVKISDEAEMAFNLGLLVGELPAIYMPGTDPLERLDQLGDMENRSTCQF